MTTNMNMNINMNIDIDVLKRRNNHKRDKYITFYEGPHIYTIDGDEDSKYTSVTTWVHSHFEEFNADEIINKMMKSRNWENNKYYGMTANEIKEEWDKNRDEAARAGTKLHYDIECYYNEVPLEKINNNSKEFGYFKNYLRDFSKLKAYRTEWMVWDKELKLAGSIDMVYENEDGSLDIYDWKRSKGIVKSKNKRFQTYSKRDCISHIPDTNYWHYSLQLNTYKYILERNYGKKIRNMRLVCLHPNNINYQIFEVKHLDEEIDMLMKSHI